MSDTSSDVSEDGGAPPARAAGPGRARRLLRATAWVLFLLLLAALGVGALLTRAPGWVLRTALAKVTQGLPPGVALEVASLEAEHLGAPDLAGVRVALAGVGEVRAGRVALRLPASQLAREIVGWSEPGPLAARLTLEGLVVVPAEIPEARLSVASLVLAATPPVVVHAEAGDIRLLAREAELVALEAAVVHAPWASLLGGRPDLTARIGPGLVDLVAVRDALHLLPARDEEVEEAETVILARLEEVLVREVALTTGAGGPRLQLVELRAAHGADPEVLLPEVTARLRLEGGGSATVAAEPREEGRRVGARVDLEGIELARLPLPLPHALAVSGGLDADLDLDLALAAPTDLRRSRGRFTLRGASLRRAGDLVVDGGDLQISLDPSRLAIDGTVRALRGRAAQALLPPLGDLALGDEVAVGLRLEAPLDLSRGVAHLRADGQLVTASGHSLRDLQVGGSWTTGAAFIDDLKVFRVGGGELRVRGQVARDSGGKPQGVTASLELLDLPGAALGLPELLGIPSVSTTLATTMDLATPLALRADGELRVRELAPNGQALAPLGIPFSIAPAALRVGPVELDLGGVAASASLLVTDVARARLQARGARFRVPRLGPVELALRGRVTAAPGVPKAPGESVLGRWVRAAGRPDFLEHLSLRWHLGELAVTGDEGPLLALADSVGGVLDPDAGRAHLDPVEAEILDAHLEVGGVLGARPEDHLRIELEGVPLLRLVDLAVPGTQLAVQGTLATELRLGAALGAPRLTGDLAWRGDPGVSLWQRQGDVIRRLGMALPNQDWIVKADAQRIELDGEYLDVDLPAPPRPGPVRVELSRFPVRVESKAFPSRVQEVDLDTRTSLLVEVDPADPIGARAVLELSAAGMVPTTAQPRSLALTASLSPRHAELGDLRVLGADGEVRVAIHGGLALDRDTTLGLELADLPVAWFEAFGLPRTAIDTIHLRVGGRLGALVARPGERLVESLLRLAGETPRQRLDDVSGELRVEQFAAREGTKDVAHLDAPLVVHLDARGLVVEPASLDLQGHRLTVGGTLTSDPQEGSEIALNSDGVPLRSLLEIFLRDVPGDLGGSLDGDVRVRGPLQAPSFSGGLSLLGLDARLPYMDSRLRGEVRVRADRGGVRLTAPGLMLDQTALSLDASLPTSGPGAAVAVARLGTKGLVLRRGRSRVGPIDLNLDAGADLGTQHGHLLGAMEVKGGTLVLDDLGPMGILREALARQRAAGASAPTTAPTQAGTEVVTGEPARAADAAGLGAGHRLDLRLRLSSPLMIRSPLVDASVLGEIHVQKDPGVPLFVEGEAQLRRGSVFLHRHEFKIVEGRVELRLAGGYFSSSLRALAEANVADHRIRLEVRGTLDEPLVAWRSTPARSEQEITHLLATGRLPGQGGALSGAAKGVAEFLGTTSLNRMLSSSLGVSSVRIRRDGGVSRFDVDKQLDNRTVVTYSRGTDNSDRLSIERRVGGTTTVEGGRKRDQEGARPFVGIKRRLRFR